METTTITYTEAQALPKTQIVKERLETFMTLVVTLPGKMVNSVTLLIAFCAVLLCGIVLYGRLIAILFINERVATTNDVHLAVVGVGFLLLAFSMQLDWDV